MSHLEAQFLALWERFAPDAPAPVTQHRFAPPRRFRFDFAWLEAKVAVEIDGGVWVAGRHTRGSGVQADYVKLNLATAGGWRVLRFTSNMLDDDPVGVVEQVVRLVCGERER